MSIEAMKQWLEALEPFEKLFTQADKQGRLAGANVDCQIATNDLRKSAYAASDIRAYLNTTPQPKREWVELTDEDMKALVDQARKAAAEVPCPDYNERLLTLANNKLREKNGGAR
jgi:hypothetical protein